MISGTYHSASNITDGYGVGGYFEKRVAGSGACYFKEPGQTSTWRLGSGGQGQLAWSRCWYMY